MNKIYCLLFVLLYQAPLSAQLHDAHWILGEHTSFGDTTYTGVMDFNMTAEPILDNSIFKVVTFFRTNSSFSDAEGNLLVFTNGSKFFDANGNIIPGGEDLHPGDNREFGYPLRGNQVFFNNPNGSNSFYSLGGDLVVFNDINNGVSAGIDSIFLFKFDYESNLLEPPEITIDGGRNIIVQDTFSDERLAVIRHANGRDWWTILNYHESNRYLKLLFNPDGVSEYDTQEIGEETILGGDYSVSSPDGRFYSVYSLSGLVQGPSESSITWYEFDRCTGKMSNYNRHVLSTNGVGSKGGVAFSPNSRFMYVAMEETIYQFDMEAEDVVASKIEAATYDGHIDSSLDSTSMIATKFNLMQLAPNGKIYITVPWTRSRHLHVIDQPDSLGVACNVIQRGLELPYYHWFNMPSFPNYRLGPLPGSPCDTLGPVASFLYADTDNTAQVRFTDQSAKAPTSWLWDFGDGTTSTTQNPSHTYLTSDTYEVCLRVENRFGADSTCQQIPVIFTGTKELVNADLFKIFPNPVTDYFTVQSGLEISGVEVYASDGRLLLSKNDRKVLVADLAGGLYIVKVLFEDGRVGFGKVVRE